MKKNKKTKINNQSGAAMLLSIVFFLFISLAISFGLVSPSVRQYKIANNLEKSNQSFFLSESAVEDTYYRLKEAMTVGTTNTLTLNGNSATATITDSGYNEKTITALGDVSSRERTSEMVLNAGDGVSFSYGIQAGTGGFILGNSTVNGNVYSNGSITGANGATITGSAISAGASGVIDNVDVGTGTTGDAWANTVRNSNVLGNLYCNSGTNNNKACVPRTNPSVPPVVGMPITDTMFNKWKSDAALGGEIDCGASPAPTGCSGGTYTIGSSTSLGPVKIIGNLAINANLVITGTLYITGNITTNNGAQISLHSSYGPTGGIIVSDGRVTLSNNASFSGSGVSGTYILLATTSACPSGCSGQNAMEILNNVGAVLVSAQNGTVHLNNNVSLNEVVGNVIDIDNSATVNYLSGLASQNFTSGPSGGWNIKSWEEVE
jgi:hypothetical protein